jgi:RNA polymerase sigma factor (sigma-70 family)
VRENQGIIYKLVGLYARDTEEKKDLYQEILLQTWKAYPGFRGDSKFSTWLYRVSLNTIFSHRRKESRRPDTTEPQEDHHAVENQAPERQEKEALRKAIRQLKETDRAVVTLHLDGYGNGEIADIMGITPNNVAVKLNRIRTQLQNLLNPGS